MVTLNSWMLINKARQLQHAILTSVGKMSPILKEYKDLWDTCVLRKEYIGTINTVCYRINMGKDRYEGVAKILGNGIPWWFIGITHFMEAGHKKNPFDFHLHCGDPLTARTVNVPEGRPVADPIAGPGKPYTWEESALDALRHMKYDLVKDWTLYNCLYLFEKFNGGGYKKRKINTPYLWSFTNHYGDAPNIGKFVSDGKFDANAISKQAGCAAILKRLTELGSVTV